jgi:transposase
MAVGRPKAAVVITAAERETLERWARRPKTAQALAHRARIVLACGSGATNLAVAARVGVTHQRVGKWRGRFITRRLDGLLDEPRPGAPRRVQDGDVERVLTLTLESLPRDATPWSTRRLAARVGLSQSTVSRIWRAFALQPHRTESFTLSKDPLFIENVRDIVGLYLALPSEPRRRARSRARPGAGKRHEERGRSPPHSPATAPWLFSCPSSRPSKYPPRDGAGVRRAPPGGSPSFTVCQISAEGDAKAERPRKILKMTMIS